MASLLIKKMHQEDDELSCLWPEFSPPACAVSVDILDLLHVQAGGGSGQHYLIELPSVVETFHTCAIQCGRPQSCGVIEHLGCG